MTTAHLHQPADTEPGRNRPECASDTAARISFRQSVSTDGFIDAAWWPRSIDLTTELPPLLDVLWTAAREITRVTYNSDAWNPAPRRMRIQDRTVRLGGFTTSDPLTIRLSDALGATIASTSSSSLPSPIPPSPSGPCSLPANPTAPTGPTRS